MDCSYKGVSQAQSLASNTLLTGLHVQYELLATVNFKLTLFNSTSASL